MSKEKDLNATDATVNIAAEGNVNGAAAPKRRGRGISNETKATSQIKFHERDATPSGLFIGYIKEVLVDWRTLKDDVRGLPSFAGLSIPRFVVHYVSTHTDSALQRHAYITFLPVESNVETIDGGKFSWQAENLFKWMKHLINVLYLKGREFTTEEIDALSLPFYDTDEEGAYVYVEPEEVIVGYKFVFENVAAMLNGSWNLKEGETAKPTFIDDKGKPRQIWAKMLRFQKTKGEWKGLNQNGDLSFPNFPGTGVLELVTPNTAPTMCLNAFTESITPKQVNKAPNYAPNMPGLGAPAGAVPSNNFGAPTATSTAFTPGGYFDPNDAKDDMPF